MSDIFDAMLNKVAELRAPVEQLVLTGGNITDYPSYKLSVGKLSAFTAVSEEIQALAKKYREDDDE